MQPAKIKTSTDGIITQHLVYDPSIQKVEVYHYIKVNEGFKAILSKDYFTLNPKDPTNVFNGFYSFFPYLVIKDESSSSDHVEYFQFVLAGLPHLVEASVDDGGVTSKVSDPAD